MTPEVLKMLQQMAPTARTESDGDEPDEIKVPPHKAELKLDILCIANAFSVNTIRWRTESPFIPSDISSATEFRQFKRTGKTHSPSITKTTLYQPCSFKIVFPNSHKRTVSRIAKEII